MPKTIFFILFLLLLTACTTKETQSVQKKDAEPEQSAKFEGDNLVQTLSAKIQGETVIITGELRNPLNSALTLQTANPTLDLELFRGSERLFGQYDGMMFTMEIRELRLAPNETKNFEWVIEKKRLGNGNFTASGKWNIYIGESDAGIQKVQTVSFDMK